MMLATVVERHRSKRPARHGFTLVELVIVMLILGIITTVAAPKFADSLHRIRAEQAAERIKVDLGYLRQTAISQSATLSATFTPGSDAYSIAGLPDLNAPGQAYAVTLTASPYNATLVSASLGGDGEIQFDRYGKPDSGGVITVQAGGYQETVTIDPTTGIASIP